MTMIKRSLLLMNRLHKIFLSFDSIKNEHDEFLTDAKPGHLKAFPLL